MKAIQAPEVFMHKSKHLDKVGKLLKKILMIVSKQLLHIGKMIKL
jgi:hypothetical protein